MRYSADFFTEEKEASLRREYQYITSGGFYDVYIGYDGRYHMSLEDYDSLLARFDFYEKFNTEPYPVFTSAKLDGSELLIERYVQIIGLPHSVMTRRAEDGRLIAKSKDEIMDSITFHADLAFDDGRRDKDDFSKIPGKKDFFFSDSIAMLHAINYLIANGFYLLNPERIVNPFDDEGFFPVAIDVRRLPERYLHEEETADKLIVDFVANPLFITKDVYKNKFKPLDDLTLEEKFDFAFERDKDDDEATIEVRRALRLYFFSIARDLFNDFFHEAGLYKFVAGLSVIDHDMRLSVPYTYAYFGTHFIGYKKRVRYLYKDGDEIRQQVVPGDDLYFDRDDKTRISFAYNSVKRYLDRHPDNGYITPVILKLMGLPSELLDTLAYFDFERAESKDLLRFLKFEDDLDINNTNYFHIYADGNGEVTLFNDQDSGWKIEYLLDHLEDDGIFLSDPSSLIHDREPSLLIVDLRRAAHSPFSKIISGDYETLKKGVEMFMIDFNSSLSFFGSYEKLSDFLNKYADSDKIPQVELYFSYLSEGFTQTEAYQMLDIHDDLELRDFLVLIASALSDCIFIHEKKFNHRIFDISEFSLVNHFSSEEIIYDPFSEYPYIHKGRFFLGYSKEIDSEVYLDRKDLTRIQTYYHLLRSHERDMTPAGDDLMFCDLGFIRVSYSFGDLDLRLGLPSGCDEISADEKGRLKYPYIADDISIFDREDHASLIRDDEILSGLKIELALLDDGVMIGNGAYGRTPILVDLEDERVPEELRLYLSPDHIKYSLCKTIQFVPEVVKSEISPLYSPKKLTKFKDLFIDGLSDHFKSEITHGQYLARERLSDYVQSTLRNYYSSRLNGDDESILFAYPDDEKRIYPGALFYALSSEDGESLLLSREDKKLLSRAYQAVLYLTRDEKQSQYRSYLASLMCGTPEYMATRTAKMFQDHDFIYSDDMLDLYKEADIDEFPYKKYPSLTYDNKMPTRYRSMITGTTLFRHQLLKDGFYICYFSDFSELFPEITIDENQEPISQSPHRFCYVFPDCTSLVREVFLPDQLMLQTVLDKFLTTTIIKEQFPEIAFELQEFIEQVYLDHPDFLLRARNALAISQDRLKKYLRDISRSYESTNHDEKSHQNYLFLLVLFLLYYLDNLVITKVKREL